ncbi:hypothetical protein AMJ39_09670 [candidate division TA06 bacterium DG_24]|uniref:Uncharacterized protein n=1 Tax=candidate division TA06 bacterium DG_24 TaxID=1703770 RepID=A0A0S7WNS6_UNCT6|nr:MAG: hypothetical protein AMJ39_09670 [candidate division TA06 bacterium DG_24]
MRAHAHAGRGLRYAAGAPRLSCIGAQVKAEGVAEVDGLVIVGGEGEIHGECDNPPWRYRLHVQRIPASARIGAPEEMRISHAVGGCAGIDCRGHDRVDRKRPHRHACKIRELLPRDSAVRRAVGRACSAPRAVGSPDDRSARQRIGRSAHVERCAEVIPRHAARGFHQ